MDISPESLNQVVGLLYTAPLRFSGLCATGRFWIRPKELAEAEREWLATQEPGSVASLTPVDSGDSASHLPTAGADETIPLRIRMSSPGEHHLVLPDTLYGSPAAGSLNYESMIRPLTLIPHIVIDSIEEVTAGDRRAIRLEAKPRRQNIDVASSPMWNEADEYELIVDKERGVLLSLLQLHKGKVFAGEELQNVTFDSPLTQPSSRWDSIAEVVGLLYSARNSFSTVRASMRQWFHDQGDREEGGTASASRVEKTGSTLTIEVDSQLWIGNPTRFRQEITTRGSPGDPTAYLLNGDTWWEYYSSGFVGTNAPREQIPVEVDVTVRSEPVHPMYEDAEYAIISQTPLDPSWLISGLWMEPGSRLRYAGREAIRVQAKPIQEDNSEWYWWEGADEYELLVDVERGILLRIEARRHGKGFAGIEVTQIEFDVPIPEETFVFTPSPGMTVVATPPAL